MTVFYEVEHPSEEEDIRAWQSPMVTVTLIMTLETTAIILLPSHLSSISATPRIQLRSLNAIIKVNKITVFLTSTKCLTFCTLLLPKNGWKWKISLRQPMKNWILYGLTEANFHFHWFFGSKVVQKDEKWKLRKIRSGILSPPVFSLKTPNYVYDTAQKASSIHEIKIKSIGSWQTEKQFGQGPPLNGHLIR